jgi:hypothetical protein
MWSTLSGQTYIEEVGEVDVEGLQPNGLHHVVERISEDGALQGAAQHTTRELQLAKHTRQQQ